MTNVEASNLFLARFEDEDEAAKQQAYASAAIAYALLAICEEIVRLREASSGDR